MKAFYFPLGLAIAGMLLYHLAQKSVPREMNPFFATIIAYLVGIVLCAICAFAFPGCKSFLESAKESNWAVFCVGLAVVAIELGFLLTYRAGWKISIAALLINVAVSVLLIPIGIVIFKDQLSVRNIVGLILCVLGLALLA